MKAIYVSEPGKMEIVDKEMPQITGTTQVLVRITAAGICGSDIHILHGTHAYATYPRVIGHEGCGVEMCIRDRAYPGKALWRIFRRL